MLGPWHLQQDSGQKCLIPYTLEYGEGHLPTPWMVSSEPAPHPHPSLCRHHSELPEPAPETGERWWAGRLLAQGPSFPYEIIRVGDPPTC